MLPDWLAFILTFVYLFAAIGVGELLRRTLLFSQDFSRKFIHIAVGMISIPTVLWYRSLTWAIIPPLVFIALNYLDYRFGFSEAMKSADRRNLGTVYFPISFAAILALFWGDPARPTSNPHLIVAALMPLTWGDALAAVAGARWGKHRYTVLGSTRSLEGSLVMFAASLLATFLALGHLPLGPRALAALAAAAGAVAAEAVSPWGIDNLTVPAVSALILAILALPI